MAKSVHLRSGLTFSKIKDAKEYFSEILKNTPKGTQVATEHFEQLNALFLDYCDATAYPVTSKPVGFSHKDNPVEISPGQFRTTSCYFVRFEDGSERDFSYIKAVSEIANYGKNK